MSFLAEYQVRLQKHQEEAKRRAVDLHPAKRPAPPPVQDQIRALLATLPPASVMRPWSLDELRSQITGRFGRPPQRGEVAAALKLLGFTPVRLWRKGFDGRHAWLPEGYELPRPNIKEKL